MNKFNLYSPCKKYLLYLLKRFTLKVVRIRGKSIKTLIKYQYPRGILCVFLLPLLIAACGDDVVDTSKSVSKSNEHYKLTLTVSNNRCSLDDFIKVTATVERLVARTSAPKMRIDAVGGTIDEHSYKSSTTQGITVSLGSTVNSSFEAMAFFVPKSLYSTTRGYYSWSPKAHVTASADGINLSLEIKLIDPE